MPKVGQKTKQNHGKGNETRFTELYNSVCTPYVLLRSSTYMWKWPGWGDYFYFFYFFFLFPACTWTWARAAHMTVVIVFDHLPQSNYCKYGVHTSRVYIHIRSTVPRTPYIEYMPTPGEVMQVCVKRLMPVGYYFLPSYVYIHPSTSTKSFLLHLMK